ncbi:MAG: Sugar transferase [uncultured bacterium]|nr:MAG: Sugar transferase [uncultured bacterium]
MKTLAPICLFVYNRLWHTKQTIDALKNNHLASDSELFIFSDGAKNKETIAAVSNVRSYIQTINGFKKVHIILRETNLGLANNIVSGVSEIVNLYKQVIVLEDDLVSSPFFLKYMNDALDLYKYDESVASIHGYVYPINYLPETFFLKGADCWGWATWDRAWADFEPNGRTILNEINERKLKREIDFNNSNSYVKMLKDQIKGKNDSWAIRWHLSAFLKDKLTLYPGKSFVKNIGCDNSGQHSKATTIFDPIMCEKYIGLKKIPIIDNADAYKKYELYYNENKKSIFIKGFRHFLNISRKHLLKTK